MSHEEDSHFLIDNAHPEEMRLILLSLNSATPLSIGDLRDLLYSSYGYEGQKNLSLSTRRLVDLGLAAQQSTSVNKAKWGYRLVALGEKVRSLHYERPALYPDVMHFLHYAGDPGHRKLFLSYRWCCEIVWDRKEMPTARSIALEIQSRIAQAYPEMYAQRVGGNFNIGGVSAWKAWLATLVPLPFAAEAPASRTLVPRTCSCYELPLLALDHVYRSRDYRYGDPMILDDALLDEIARVFFLDPVCCRELLDLAAQVTRAIALRDTFAGTSIKLLAPYGVMDL